jgi:hypothetical protein
MTFLDRRAPSGSTLAPLLEGRRLGLLRELLDRFGRAFPSITYEAVLEVDSINAQAWRSGSQPYVRVYGGLVRHPALSTSGISLVLAHETGHHLGGPPYDHSLPWMSWQGQADYWAACVGMPKVWGPNARRMTLKGAIEIASLHRHLRKQLKDECEPDLSLEDRLAILRCAALGQGMPSWVERPTADVRQEQD